jgi:hypothetical protein
MNFIFSVFHILGIIIPTDELIFFRGVGHQPDFAGYGPCSRVIDIEMPDGRCDLTLQVI